jgi:hypothetical protein
MMLVRIERYEDNSVMVLYRDWGRKEEKKKRRKEKRGIKWIRQL